MHYMRVFRRTIRKGEARAMAVILAVVTLLALNSNMKPADYPQKSSERFALAQSLNHR
ncbi:hypothetical protein SDC9_202853 [bioreactor metagenome]|uniref:Uncharacterized protein n=1 Tax=bioreactor metagenome TaxID=1076179 RepID=A0A645J3V4_9ZZZZ